MKIRKILILTITLCLMILFYIHSGETFDSPANTLEAGLLQEDAGQAGENTPPPPPEALEIQKKNSFPFSDFEVILSISVLLFGLLIIFTEIYLIKVKNFGPEQSIKFVVVTLIIFSALFLITAGYSNDQIAPAMGLLGTVAGYLLGKIDAKTDV